MEREGEERAVASVRKAPSRGADADGALRRRLKASLCLLVPTVRCGDADGALRDYGWARIRGRGWGTGVSVAIGASYI
jgi:hypothetical protein